MRKIIIAVSALALLSGAPATVEAAGTQNGATVGDCISDGLYGNEPNIEDPAAPGGPQEQEPGTRGGRVVPSQSPGPQVNNPNDPENPLPGRSVGDWNRILRALNLPTIPQLCRAATNEP